ncbi:MAG TPA: GGDEF domain-containing protein [Noviherbaspirillum sp.]|nr:GGDEF domain-containing protein [Noviherbaspirillum sp.]
MAVLDAAAGFEISLLIVHIIPVLIVTWFAGARWGYFFAALMATISALTIADAAPFLSNLAYRYLDLVSDFAAISVMVYVQAKLRESYDVVRRQSKTDALTGCLNKAGFREQLQTEIDRHRRYDHPFSLAYFDCDNFKQVNDTLGHHAGDLLLAEIGRVLRAELRNVDAVGRLGGDEFAVLLRETAADAAEHAASFMKRGLDTAMRQHDWPVGFSIGIVCFNESPQDADKALAAADAVMYEVKRQGKNGILLRPH